LTEKQALPLAKPVLSIKIFFILAKISIPHCYREIEITPFIAVL
jgi:hypothetical protein